MDPAIERAVRVARALSDARRFELLQRIAAAGEICCRDLTTLFPVSQATVSHHLKVLTGAGLVEARIEGQFHYFRLCPGTLRAHASSLARAFPARRRAPKASEGRVNPKRRERKEGRT